MPELRLLDATSDDIGLIVAMIRQMVADMAGHGGHAPARDEASWDKVAAEVAEDIAEPRVRLILAQSGTGDWLGVGRGKLVTLGGAFAPKETLHISAVYVVPQFRRAGIARALVEAMLNWGRAAGATECDLNVLSRNPARALYESLGFATAQVKMVLPLTPGPSDDRTT
jgi:GNAT superfamily N-acetyltransferase